MTCTGRQRAIQTSVVQAREKISQAIAEDGNQAVVKVCSHARHPEAEAVDLFRSSSGGLYLCPLLNF